MEENITVRIKKVNNQVSDQNQNIVPKYATAGAAGADLYACLKQDLVIKPGDQVRIPTGIALEIPNANLVGLIFARSGLASKKGLTLSNGVGVIDSDYRGEIIVLMINLGQEDVAIQNGDRIAQMVFVNICKASFVKVDELGDTSRGDGGFGSTGQK